MSPEMKIETEEKVKGVARLLSGSDCPKPKEKCQGGFQIYIPPEGLELKCCQCGLEVDLRRVKVVYATKKKNE